MHLDKKDVWARRRQVRASAWPLQFCGQVNLAILEQFILAISRGNHGAGNPHFRRQPAAARHTDHSGCEHHHRRRSRRLRSFEIPLVARSRHARRLPHEPLRRPVAPRRPPRPSCATRFSPGSSSAAPSSASRFISEERSASVVDATRGCSARTSTSCRPSRSCAASTSARGRRWTGSAWRRACARPRRPARCARSSCTRSAWPRWCSGASAR